MYYVLPKAYGIKENDEEDVNNNDDIRSDIRELKDLIFALIEQNKQLTDKISNLEKLISNKRSSIKETSTNFNPKIDTYTEDKLKRWLMCYETNLYTKLQCFKHTMYAINETCKRLNLNIAGRIILTLCVHRRSIMSDCDVTNLSDITYHNEYIEMANSQSAINVENILNVWDCFDKAIAAYTRTKQLETTRTRKFIDTQREKISKEESEFEQVSISF